MSNYWPWWAGALGLAFVTIAYTVLADRSLGVSSAWDRVAHWRSERDLERLDAQFTDEHALAEALAAATVAHFGTGAVAHRSLSGALDLGRASGGARRAADEKVASSSSRPAPLVTQAALLVSVFLGGLLAALTSGRFKVRLDMGAGFRELVTNNSTMMICVLFAGGVLVGFGTRLAGGCSSGHGLSGCGRLRPVSIVATAAFFGTAVIVSFLLWKVI